LFGFGKILYQPIAPKDLDSYFSKTVTHFLEHTLVPQKTFRQTLNYNQPNHTYKLISFKTLICILKQPL
jgi:hypothetical protein